MRSAVFSPPPVCERVCSPAPLRIARTRSEAGKPDNAAIASFGPLRLPGSTFRYRFFFAGQETELGQRGLAIWAWMRSLTSEPASGSEENVAGNIMVHWILGSSAL